MCEAERLNQILKEHAPAAARCLSDTGLRAAFPSGIPFQAAAAKKTSFNATIGQVTDGDGGPMPIPSLSNQVPGLDPRTCFLYSPVVGHTDLLDAWRDRQRGLAGLPHAACSRPIATHGLTHGLSLVADLFVGEITTVVLPDPHWENYNLIFTMRGQAQVVNYPFFREGRFNVEGLAEALGRVEGRPSVVLLNFPSNPTGYSPTVDEARQIVDAVVAHPGPSIVVVDDAYQGVVFESNRLAHSIFWDLAARADPSRILPVKIDGATKELLFFPSRLGFLSTSLTGEAEAALLSKLKCVVRGTVGSPPGPSAAMVHSALRRGELQVEFNATMEVLKTRYLALRRALQSNAGVLRPLPFNSAYFALVGLPDHIRAEDARLRLIEEHSVGLIAVPSINALRVAFCSTKAEDLPLIVDRIHRVASSGPR